MEYGSALPLQESSEGQVWQISLKGHVKHYPQEIKE